MRLNHFDYEESSQITREGYTFVALIAAAMRQADTGNMRKLSAAFPLVAADLEARYNAPGGFLPWETRAEPVPNLEDLDASAGEVIDLMAALKASLESRSPLSEPRTLHSDISEDR
jgi:hypothetical protein